MDKKMRVEELENIRKWLRYNLPSDIEDFSLVTDFALSLIQRIEELENE